MSDSNRYVCIHGHFYQPPRENPWLEAVETQDSAAPYHDWNDRITAECYATNGASRIVNRDNEIIRILNNYARISFNFGPTLLSWLVEKAPRTYRMILDADVRSRKRFGGHGSAVAQVYNHLIMPLANTRDRLTQIRWGIADFQSRFGRRPEGMWLAETAVDTESLELLAEEGILFTILAPSQCARVRPLAGPMTGHAADETAPMGETPELPWENTSSGSVDTTQPYLVRLKTGRSIAVFFYDGPRSRAIAFEGLLNSGEAFAGRLNSGFRDEVTGPQLVHVATDGESYGHHHKHGEMALSYALKHIEQQGMARLTNYGEFLARFPPTREAAIVEHSSWSCAHGVERWRSDCGCNGGKAGWNQRWRGPLRDALDWLRDTIAPLTEQAAAGLFRDPWEARDAYIAVMLDRSPESIDSFLEKHSDHRLLPQERVRALKLMELERHALLMYTSCGWFFDEISGIETVQIIAYASRVLQLAEEVFSPQHPELKGHGAESEQAALEAEFAAPLVAHRQGEAAAALPPLEARFIELLRLAESNVPELGNGAEIYLRSIKPAQVGLEEVAAHYAISSVFENFPDRVPVYSYEARRLEYDVYTSGRGRVAIGTAQIASSLTEDSGILAFAVLHFGDQNITAAVKPYPEDARSSAAVFQGEKERQAGARGTRSGPEQAAFAAFSANVAAAVARADFPEAIRLFDRYFGSTAYSLTSLFTDDQRRILQVILNSTLREAEMSLSTIYDDHASLLHFLSRAGLPKPPALELAAEFSINAGLRRAIEGRPIDAIKVRTLLALAKADQIALDTRVLSYMADQQMKRAMVALYADPRKKSALDEALAIATTLRELPFELNLWQAQNIWYDTLKLSTKNGWKKAEGKTASGAAEATSGWWNRFERLGRCLRIVVDQLVVEEEPVPGDTIGLTGVPQLP